MKEVKKAEKDFIKQHYQTMSDTEMYQAMVELGLEPTSPLSVGALRRRMGLSRTMNDAIILRDNIRRV